METMQNPRKEKRVSHPVLEKISIQEQKECNELGS